MITSTLPTNLLRVTPRRSTCPQHLQMTVLHLDLAIDVLSTAFEYRRPEMLRTGATPRRYSQQVFGYQYLVVLYFKKGLFPIWYYFGAQTSDMVLNTLISDMVLF